MDSEQFRLDRVNQMGEVSDAIYQHVDDARAETIGGDEMALSLEPHLEEAFYRLYTDSGEFALFDTPQAAWSWTWQRIKPGITAASDLADPRRIADWLGTALVNAATVTSTDSDVGKMWLSRRDDRVRPFHVDADGQTVPWDEPFTVCGGREMHFPGEPVGSPDCWINCRCAVAIRVLSASADAPMSESFGQHDVLPTDSPLSGEVLLSGAGPAPAAAVGADSPLIDVPTFALVRADGPRGRVIAAEEVLALTHDVEVVRAYAQWHSAPMVHSDGGPFTVGEEQADAVREAHLPAAFGLDGELPVLHAVAGDGAGSPEPAVTAAIDLLPEAVGDGSGLRTTGHGEIIPNAKHDVIFYEGRRTPEVVAKGAKGKKGGAGTKAGKVVKRRAATAEEEKAIARGDWLRVNRDGKKPGDGGYMKRKSKIRPQNNSADDVAEYADAEEVGDMTDLMVDDAAPDTEATENPLVPWYGVLAPEGIDSGDKRMFTEGALEWRDLPIPLLWQEKSGNGHAGSVVIGSIADIVRDGNLIRASGTFAQSEESDKVIGLLAEGHLRGVSVDVDKAEMAMDDADEERLVFSRGRISAATVVPIPAFAEAFVALGTWPDAQPEQVAASVQSPTGPTADGEDIELPFVSVSEEPWDGSASRFTPEQWRKATILHVCDGEEKSCHKLPIREPGGALSRAGVHAAAARINQVDASPEQISAAKGHLRGAYKELGEEPPDVVKASADTEAFKRGPGWITNPAETKRLHDYWTRPGEPGYAKVGWGTPGDFRRLRAYLAEYLNPIYLNRTAAQWHHDALGYWPGECGKPGNPPCGSRLEGDTIAAAVELVAAGGWEAIPLDVEWFLDPKFNGPTPITVTEDGRIYGHLAVWGTCHIGIPGTCVTAPASPTGYAYYRTGTVMTNAGAVPVGQITMDTGHAGLSDGAAAASSHYDHTGTVVADVAAGEDEHGIWVAGAVRDYLSAEKVAALRAGVLSGDWRSIGGNLELVAALVVNVPGFPVPRVGIAASGAEQTTLVAAGLVVPDSGSSTDVEAAVAELVSAVADEVEARADRAGRAAALMEQTRAARVASLVNSMGGQ
jgi:hypothetical protein